MRARLLTAFTLALVLILVVVYAPPVFVTVLLGLTLLMGAWEWSAFLAVGVPWRALYVLVVAALGLWGLHAAADPARFRLFMELAVLWWFAALAWILCAPTHVGRWAAALAGLLTLLPTWVALVHIDAHWARGQQWLLFVLALAFAADTGAFFAGRRFGRWSLAPRVSPNKTWEGVIGGMLLALVLAAGGTLWFAQPAQAFLPLCLAGAGFSVIGDLTESLLKRHVHLKDSGRLFPGHGGVLDRIDSVTAATPLMTLGLIWLGAGR